MSGVILQADQAFCDLVETDDYDWREGLVRIEVGIDKAWADTQSRQEIEAAAVRMAEARWYEDVEVETEPVEAAFRHDGCVVVQLVGRYYGSGGRF